MSINKEKRTDKLFITELINSLHREGQILRGGKAETMLHDWSRELRTDPSNGIAPSRLRKIFNHEIGAENW